MEEREYEAKAYSGILAWTPILLLIGVGVLVSVFGDVWSNDQHTSSLDTDSSTSAGQWDANPLESEIGGPLTVGSTQSDEEVFEDLISDTAFAGLRLDDAHLVQEIDLLNNKWAEYSIPILVQYLDSEVSAEAWIEETEPRLAEMRVIADKLGEVTRSLPESTYKEMIVGENLRLRLRGLQLLTNLYDSVASGDAEQQQASFM